MKSPGAGPSPTNLISQEVPLVAPGGSHPAVHCRRQRQRRRCHPRFTPRLIAFNKYYGWYSSPLNGIAAWADNIHATYPTRCIGVSEYGAGASIYQHSENPVLPSNTATAISSRGMAKYRA